MIDPDWNAMEFKLGTLTTVRAKHPAFSNYVSTEAWMIDDGGNKSLSRKAVLSYCSQHLFPPMYILKHVPTLAAPRNSDVNLVSCHL